MRTFGNQESGETYRHRQGAYGVLFDGKGRIAIVDVRGKMILPGGGIEVGEDAETALQREFMEETGLLLENVCHICQTGEYMRSLDGLRCEFLIADFFYATQYRTAGQPIEHDHNLVWVDATTAASKLFRPGQRWAVEEAMRQVTL